MDFAGGFVGVSQDPQSLVLHSVIGWAVLDANAPRKERPKEKGVFYF